MKAMAWLRARPKTAAGAAVVTAATVAIGTMAFAYEGNPTTEVELHDGSVWITRSSSLLVGHFNHESQLLDGSLRTTSEKYDILQDGQDVLVLDEAESAVAAVDPATVALGDRVDLPGGAQVALGGDIVAVLDAQSGDLYAMPFRTLSGFDPADAEPVAELGEGAAVTVGVDGTVHAVSRDAGIVTVPMTADGEPEDPVTTPIEVDAGAPLSITAVGSRAVALDGADKTLLVDDGTEIPLGSVESPVLAADSAAAGEVVVATSGSLLRAPLDGADPTETANGAGAPAQPVVLGGCAYGAWDGAGVFLRDCGGDAHDLATAIPEYEPDGELVFRVNRDVVMLNDAVGGGAWLASESMQRVDNWEELTPPDDGEEEQEDDTTEETLETTLPERTQENTPPIAVDDAFGVRAGRTVIIPVLDNDSDADGDVLTITLPDGVPDLADVQLIRNGTALQVVVPEDATGGGRFVYEVDDGRGGTDRAEVRLDVHPASQNAAPDQQRVTTVAVETGGTVTYDIMPDWRDADGDDLYLAEVTPAEGDEATFTSDGRITYRAISGAQGPVEVEVVVSDGESAASGTLKLDVRPTGSTPPVTNADHVVVRLGQQATVSPLANDISASVEPLRLTKVDEVEGLTITPAFSDKTFTVEGSEVGTEYVQYLAASGANAVPGIVRVDVVPDEGSDLPPVAVRDIALLPAGGEVLANVLANDSDPAGGVLVVQSVSVPEDSGIAVAVLGHETLRITDRAQLQEQTTLTYRMSNGAQTVEGQVVVSPIPAEETLRPPVANDDLDVVVRAGDVVTVPVLDNDYHPNGDEIHVADELVEAPVDPEVGTAFVSNDTVRFRAGTEPQTVEAVYEVVDSTGQSDAGLVRFEILPVDEEANEAPNPLDVTVRALAGEQATVSIPLDGIDPDGDSVSLVEIASSPQRGRIEAVESDHFIYRAYDDAAGLDTFTYRVRDALGVEAVGTIRVGVAPAETANQAPYAVTDALHVRPGRTVAVPVVANDVDPDGETPGLVADGLTVPDVDGLSAEVVDGGAVEVTAPDREMETAVQYTIQDSHGATAQGVIQITVDPEVPLQAPVAQDDFVLAADVTDELTAEVDLFANDSDPDGTTSFADVAVDGGTFDAAAGILTVDVLETRQLIEYTVTDEDGLTGTAYVHVPAQVDLRPVLLDTEPLVVPSNTAVEIPLADYVKSMTGAPVILTDAEKVQAGNSDGSALVRDESTLVYTSAYRYSGADAITFEVTDGESIDDPGGARATLTIPLTVLPPENEPPEVTSSEMTAGAGDGPVSLDLATLATDIDGDDLTFALGGIASVSDVELTIDGSVLTVDAGPDTAGLDRTVGFTVSDGRNDPVAGEIAVSIAASSRPLPVANDDVFAEWDQGEALTVPVLENDVNPFEDVPLELLSATLETGEAEVEVEGDQVVVTPAGDFHGTVVVRYRVADATGAQDRMVEGRIRVTVQGVPGTPGKPTVSSVQSRQVALSWTPPSDNGSAITEYLVSSVDGAYERSCAATTCTLDGLQNNVEYQFTVVAVNAVGASEASLASQVARPDARPDTPQAPQITGFGDRSLDIQWKTPSTPGSPVESYTLEISPAPPNGIATKTGVTGNALTWEGLENGTAYQVRVRAHNLAPDPSSWSAWSATNIPATVPDAPAQPTTAMAQPVGDQARLTVSWTKPATNGDEIDGYQLQVIRGGEVLQTLPVDASQTSRTVEVDTSETDYTFQVQAKNKAGWGGWSPASEPRRAYTAPDAPTGVTATTPNEDGRIAVSWTPSDRNGIKESEISWQYALNGGEWTSAWSGAANPAGSVIAAGLSNGSTYTVSVRAVYAASLTPGGGAGTVASAGSAPSGEVIPYGAIRTPSATAERAGDGRDIRFTWTAPQPNGRDVAMQIRIDGGAWEAVDATGSITRSYGYSEPHTIEARATTAEGQVSDTVTASATTIPQARAWTTQAPDQSAKDEKNCSTDNCEYLILNVENFPAGDYRASCNSPDGPFRDVGVISIPANGSIYVGSNPHCYYGTAGNKVYVHIEGWGDAEAVVWR
ncbi:Ig-like domain-containing protein [Microbacterium sp. NPDC055683]